MRDERTPKDVCGEAKTDRDKCDFKLWLLLQLTHSGTVVDVETKTFLYSIINITTEKYCSVAFICLTTRHHFIHRFKKLELPCTAEKKQNRKRVLLNSFHFLLSYQRILSAKDEEVRTILCSIINSIPNSSNSRKNGYQRWVQCFVGS